MTVRYAVRAQITKSIGLTSLMAGTYGALTIVLGSFGYSWIQVRVSEALTPLPFLFGVPGVLGLTLGCILANFFSPVGLPDVIFGPIFTFIAAMFSWKLNFGRRTVACAYPIIINAFGVSTYVAAFYGVPYEISVLTIGAGEFIAVVILGYPLLRALERVKASFYIK